VNIAVQDQTVTRKSLVVTLDQREVAAEHAATVAEYARLARIPGFRPGKAPADMIAKRFGKDIADEFKQKVVSKAYRTGLDEAKLDVVQLIDAAPGAISPDQPVEVRFTVDVRPEFVLPDYVGLPTEVAGADLPETEVDQVIEQMRLERADFKVANRPSQKGDYVKLSYEGSIDGKSISELVSDKQIYAKVPQTWEEVDGAQEGVVPGLGKKLAELAVGDKRDISIEFPAEFAAVPALAGKNVVYAVEILEVRERVLPPLDEEFLKSHQADTVDALRNNVRNNLKMQKEYQNKSAQRRQVVDALLGKVDFEVPVSLVEGETQNVLRNFIEEQMRRGVPQEQFEKDKKELFEGARKSATARVKSQLILAKIAEKEGLQVTEGDINAFIYRESMRAGTSADKLVKQLTKDRDQLRAVQQNIIFDKAVEFLVSKATVSVKA
jgi:trigger factor